MLFYCVTSAIFSVCCVLKEGKYIMLDVSDCSKKKYFRFGEYAIPVSGMKLKRE